MCVSLERIPFFNKLKQMSFAVTSCGCNSTPIHKPFPLTSLIRELSIDSNPALKKRQAADYFQLSYLHKLTQVPW